MATQTQNGTTKNPLNLTSLGLPALGEQPELKAISGSVNAMQKDMAEIKKTVDGIAPVETNEIQHTTTLVTVAMVTGGFVVAVGGGAACYFGARKLITGV